MKKSPCSKCKTIHFNRKTDKCNKCLGRKKCYSPKCKTMVDNTFRYCFKCNKDFKVKGEDLPTGICLICSDDD